MADSTVRRTSKAINPWAELAKLVEGQGRAPTGPGWLKTVEAAEQMGVCTSTFTARARVLCARGLMERFDGTARHGDGTYGRQSWWRIKPRGYK